MSYETLRAFVDGAKAKGMKNAELTELLVEQGWSRSDIARAIYGDLPVVPTPENTQNLVKNNQTQMHVAQTTRATAEPIAVVQNLSTRGFEYYIMFVSLWVSALSLGAILHEAINAAFYTPTYYGYSSSSDGGSYTLPLTVIIVTLPIFITLFLRLKKAELQDPAIRRDPSRKKLTQTTQFFSFLIGIGYLIWFIYSLMSGRVGTSGAGTFGELFLHLLVTLSIAGGIFAYYWIDEHRAANEKTA